MNRLQKKCFVVSASLHGLLLVALVFSTAFFRSDRLLKDMGPVVDIVNAIPTDRMVNSGGNPNGNPTPPAPALPPPQALQQPPPQPVKPLPEPPKPQPKPPEVKQVKKVEPLPEVPKVKAELPVPAPKKVEKKPPVKETPPAPKPSISTKVVKWTNNPAQVQQELARKAAQQKAEREYAKQVAQYNAERARLASQVNGIVGGVGKSISQSTVVAPLGPGGLAFANYLSIVREIYDRAWHVGQDLTDDDSSAVAKVTIRRDGTVEDARLQRRSGNSLLDKSVQRALDSVRKIAPFPEGATDSERTFTIEFNLKTRKAVG
jgi:TonB family protein